MEWAAAPTDPPGCLLSSRRESFGQQLAEEHCRGKTKIKDIIMQGIRQHNKNKSHCSEEKEKPYGGITFSCLEQRWMRSSRSSMSS